MRSAAAVLAVLVAAGPAVPLPAAAAPASCSFKPGRDKVPGEPRAQQLLGFAAAHRLTTGKGVTVAVVDSGVDFSHPQLKGQSAAGPVDLTGTGPADCDGHGTRVAGIIVARPLPGVPFVGVAPGAKALSVKFAADDRGNSDALLAKGIREAVRLGAKVVNVSAQTENDSPALREAVAAAIGRDVVVVAAAGNVDEEQTGRPVPVYPAQYPGVLSVGALDGAGRVSGITDVATRVSVAAPGEAVVSTWPRSGWTFDGSGTSFAAPFVAGVAALVRSAHPELTGPQVVRRIEATASGGRGLGSGYGMVDPLQAVSALVPAEPVSASPRPVPFRAVPPDADRPRSIALVVLASALAGSALTVCLAVVLPRLRRRAPVSRSARSG